MTRRRTATWVFGLGMAAVIATAAILVVSSTVHNTAAQTVERARHAVVATASVRQVRLDANVVLRADLADVQPVAVKAPVQLGGSLAVITSVSVHPQSIIAVGTVVASVAERPVIAMTGRVPAFRSMGPGIAGIDVTELQQNLHALGLSTGSDATGAYGVGTGLAVLALYRRVGFAPVLTTVSILRSADSSETVTPKPKSPTQPAPSKFVAIRVATVPLGEVQFLTRLPARVVSVPGHLGKTLSANGVIVDIGSSDLVLRGDVDAAEASSIHKGASGVARSDLSNKSVRVRVTGIGTIQASGANGAPEYAVTLKPVGTAPPSLVGQNLAVTVVTGQTAGATLVVPVAAVITRATGGSVVTVVSRSGLQRNVRVSPGLVSGGQEAVRPISGRLAAGDQVVVGVATL